MSEETPSTTAETNPLPVERSTLTLDGRWRVYFNRMGAAPLLWCVAPVSEEWELCVSDVWLAAPAMTCSRIKPVADEDDGKPSAWFEVEGRLSMLYGRASITIR